MLSPAPLGGLAPLCWLFLFTCLVGCVEGVACPHCYGWLPSCTWRDVDNQRVCPTVTTPSANALVMGGVAAAGATLTLANVLSTRFLRIFNRAQLNAAQSLANRPVPGTIFEITAATGLQKILQAVATGQTSMEQATITLASLIDAEADGDRKTALVQKYKLLVGSKDIKGYSSHSGAPAEVGIWTWLWGMITNFVHERGMQSKVQVTVDTAASASTSSVFSTTIRRFKLEWDFAECCNLFVMYATALGLCSAILITEFLEHVVYDTIRMRGKPWQFASELLVIMLRRIEDSAGRLTLGNCLNDTYLNTVMEEAQVSTTRFYPDCFRIPPGKGGIVTNGALGAKWNGKFTASSSVGVCLRFNTGAEHTADDLHPDGTCKRNHVCDRWVTNKGAGGRCLCTEGTPGHSRRTCDNPHRSDTKQQ